MVVHHQKHADKTIGTARLTLLEGLEHLLVVKALLQTLRGYKRLTRSQKECKQKHEGREKGPEKNKADAFENTKPPKFKDARSKSVRTKPA
jgi:hypothetical protein